MCSPYNLTYMYVSRVKCLALDDQLVYSSLGKHGEDILYPCNSLLCALLLWLLGILSPFQILMLVPRKGKE